MSARNSRMSVPLYARQCPNTFGDNSLTNRRCWKLSPSYEAESRLVDVEMRDLVIGMVFGEDLKSPSGVLRDARGQEVNTGLLECLRHLPG